MIPQIMDVGTRQIVLWKGQRKQQERKIQGQDEMLHNSGKRIRASVFTPATDVAEYESWSFGDAIPFHGRRSVSTGVRSKDDEYESRRRACQRDQDKRRTEALNRAFTRLRASLPHVPPDTKLTKLRTLRIAIEYIRQLQAVVQMQSRDTHPAPSPSFPPAPPPPWPPDTRLYSPSFTP